MNRPLDRLAPIDARRFSRWLASFAGYRNVTQRKIELWLEQFDPADRDLAARVLDAIYFVDQQHIRNAFNDALMSIPGWSKNPSERSGRWLFVPFSSSAGESGDSMLHGFRMATGLTLRRYDSLFYHRSQLLSATPGPEDTVVLVDDFSGTGNQATTSWSSTFAELLPGGPRTFLLLVAATDTALNKIREKTEMEPICEIPLTSNRSSIFSPGCPHFTQAEKDRLLTYCARADRAHPKGYGDCGLVVVLAHRCPNNSIPVLHAVNRHWDGLFPRD